MKKLILLLSLFASMQCLAQTYHFNSLNVSASRNGNNIANQNVSNGGTIKIGNGRITIQYDNNPYGIVSYQIIDSKKIGANHIQYGAVGNNSTVVVDVEGGAISFTEFVDMGMKRVSTYYLSGTSYNNAGQNKQLSEFDQLKLSAQQGDADAQLKLAEKYATKDDSKAFYWLKKAAAQGNADAQYYLGDCYERGGESLSDIGIRNVSQDKSKAFYWYQKAAVQGNVDALCNLARFYHFGIGGVPKDVSKAVEWYKKATENGEWGYKSPQVHSAEYLAEIYEKGDGNVPKDVNKAVEWYQKIADRVPEYRESAEEDIKRLLGK